MSGASLFTATARQAKKFIIRCMLAGRVAFLEGSPAIGKSAVIKSIAKEYKLKVIDLRLSTATPEDMTGLPRFKDDGRATFAAFDSFPLEGDELPEGYEGWLLFLDEFNSAPKAVQAAGYKLVFDRMVGLNKLHERVVIVAAGNLSTDRAITNPLSTAMQSRLIHIQMVLDHQEVMEDVAIPAKWDGRIVAYLNYKKANLHDFRPDHNEKTFCSPRTWEFMNDLIKGYDVIESDAALYAGTITSGVAVDFITFTKVYATLLSIKDIIADPENVPLPNDAATRWATITHLIENVTDKNFDPITLFINRLPAEFKVLFYRSLMVHKPELKKHPAFRKAMVELSRYLHDDEDVAKAA